MRILLVVPWEQEFGGVTSVVGNLGRYLKSQNHEIMVLYPGRSILPNTRITKTGFTGFDLRLQTPLGARHPIISMMAFLILFPIGFFQLIRLIKKNRVEIVNIHFPGDYAFYFGLCRLMLPIRLITSIHGNDFFPKGKRKIRYSRAIRFFLGSSDLIVAPSESYRRDFLSIFPELESKTTFIHNSIDLGELDGQEEHRNRNDDNRYLLCIATHNEKKGLDVLVRAAARLADLDFRFNLLLAGDGPLRGQLEELVRSLGLGERVTFLGWQRRSEIVNLLHGCEALVLPSRSEPFGIAVLEGMACKKPVVATSVGGIPEIIENGKNGILVEPDNPDALAEALATVLRDRNLRLAIATEGYETVRKRFCSETMGATYEAAFRDVLTQPRNNQGRPVTRTYSASKKAAGLNTE